MAIGEGACVSVHGANRLGSNSLIDLLVFGRAAACRAVEVVNPTESHPPLPDTASERAIDRLDRIRHAAGARHAGEIRVDMQRIMQRHCAVFRDGLLLEEGVEKIDALGLQDLRLADRSMLWNTDLADALELDNLIAQAAVSLHSARARTESRGAHAREDYPQRDDTNWLKHTLAWRDESGSVRLDYRPVHLFTLSNEVNPIPPKERTY
jgi:succinate dehydrogenase / fumarate reductase flavoprotein subunit